MQNRDIKNAILSIPVRLGVLLILLTSILPATPARAAGVVWYVKPAATGAGDCSSWADACMLQTALGGASSGDEIWVMAGTYTPTSGTDRAISFQLVNAVATYGGFAGTETLLGDRDPRFLRGDVDQDLLVHRRSRLVNRGTRMNTDKGRWTCKASLQCRRRA
jgi:hypothetical protein